jgi:hypothetical protein
MLSSIYEINPRFYEEYINSLMDENMLIEVIPSFKQQVNNKGNGFMDGHITTKKTSIIIETKMHSLEAIEKLVKYSDSFRDDEVSVLIHLSASTYQDGQTEEIRDRLMKKGKDKNIKFYSLSYENLVEQLNQLNQQYPYIPELHKLTSNFEQYCQSMDLLPSYKNILRAMACGHSAELNVKHCFYFDFADRGFSDFKYFGVYQKKAVTHIALVENIVEADWSAKDGLKIKDSTRQVTDDQRKRLSLAIQDTIAHGWSIERDHRFFLLKDLIPTDFRKTSPGGIFRVRYFNLDEVQGSKVSDNILELADRLRQVTWK